MQSQSEGLAVVGIKNLAARNRVGTGGDILISGFVISGTGNATLLIRGVGPTLFDSFAIADRLLDPSEERELLPLGFGITNVPLS